MAAEGLQLLRALAEGLAKLIDAPVVVGIFEGAGDVLVDLHVVGHVAEAVVIFKSESSRRRYLRMYSIGAMHYGFPELLCVVSAEAFHICIGHD